MKGICDNHYKIKSRIIFKILLLVHKCVQGICSNNLKIGYKTYNCLASDYMLLKTKSCETKYRMRMFGYVVPRLWNALPIHVCTEENTDDFKRIVKAMLFADTEGFKWRAFL